MASVFLLAMVQAVSHGGGWNVNDTLALFSALVAVATILTALATVRTANASKKMAGETHDLATETKGMADKTGELVIVTSQQAEFAKQSLDQERLALESSVRPLIADVPMHVLKSLAEIGEVVSDRIYRLQGSDWVQLELPIRNIGAGPAFLGQCWLSPKPGLLFDAAPKYQVLPVNEVGSVGVYVKKDDPKYTVLQESWEFKAIAQYRDLGGSQRTQSELSFRFRETQAGHPGDAYVTKVEMFECDEKWVRAEKPFVSTGTA